MWGIFESGIVLLEKKYYESSKIDPKLNFQESLPTYDAFVKPVYFAPASNGSFPGAQSFLQKVASAEFNCNLLLKSSLKGSVTLCYL